MTQYPRTLGKFPRRRSISTYVGSFDDYSWYEYFWLSHTDLP